MTSLAGLPLYLELIHRSGLAAAIRQQVQVAGGQGWLDIQMVLAVVFLNLAGGVGGRIIRAMPRRAPSGGR